MADSMLGLKVYSTWEILEKVDPTEYVALSSDNKSLLSLIISAGTVRMNDDSPVRGYLVAMFPSNTVTGAKIAAM